MRGAPPAPSSQCGRTPTSVAWFILSTEMAHPLFGSRPRERNFSSTQSREVVSHAPLAEKANRPADWICPGGSPYTYFFLAAR